MQNHSDRWEGLQSRICECAGRKNFAGHEFARSTLLLHQISGRSFEVVASGVAWKFEARAKRFDYYPTGIYESIACGPVGMRATQVEIPVAFEMSVLEEGHWGSELAPRFQFQDRRLEGLVESLVHAADGPMVPADAVLLSVAVVDRLYETAQPMNTSRAESPRFTNTVKRLIVEYIDQYIGSSIDIDKVAFLTGLARTQFGKIFRASFEMPLHQYVISRKIQLATKRLLQDVRVTEISQELGFSSHAHFSTVFRQYMGQTPSQFRKDYVADRPARAEG
jgi:AraC-like DNA-binding protein